MSNARPFLDFLREHRGGATHDDLSEKLQELVANVTAEGKPGKLTFVLTLKPAGTRDGALTVMDEVKLTLPKETKSGSIFFASEDNNLVREDPKQRRLPLQELNKRGEAREIGPSASVANALA
jgi:hypothetical protein